MPNRPILKRQISEEEEGPEKPYALIPFPTQPPTLGTAIAGHNRYSPAGYHGILFLKLRALTALHVSTGIIAMGRDVGSKEAIIKTMTVGRNKRLVIQGSSLKGCVRSIYETITNSRLGVLTHDYKDRLPRSHRPHSDKDSKDKLCSASQVFGALDWQGLLSFQDARCQMVKPSTGFMPSLYSPQPDKRKAYFSQGKAVGRKFYYHMRAAIDGGKKGAPVQQAGIEYTFKTALQFKNLSQAQLGALFVALGQDATYPIAWKLGGGKPVGFGTVQVQITAADVVQDVRARYSQYATPEANKEGEILSAFVQEAIAAAYRENLIEKEQLRMLHEVLKKETTREAVEEY